MPSRGRRGLPEGVARRRVPAVRGAARRGRAGTGRRAVPRVLSAGRWNRWGRRRLARYAHARQAPGRPGARGTVVAIRAGAADALLTDGLTGGGSTQVPVGEGQR